LRPAASLRAALLLAALSACAPGLAAAAEGPAPTRRLALVMGANSGGEGRARLRYAVSDAKSFASLLTELGGVRDEDLVLLLEPGLSSFRAAAERLRARAAAAGEAGQRCELMLYYSGHSDEEGLLLGKERLGYSELRASIERVPSAVRVAILDSCSSGSLTRAKGGSSRPAFLYDASAEMEGHAYITSSSEAEAAQESDRIGGSFFTHYLLSALRGAADLRGEGKVTLNEAYAYAFRETLASTENTQYGPQHPAYEISLTGSGDLVFTDLRSSRSGLALAEALSGALFIRDAKGKLAVELDKAAGDRMDIGLPPGRYSASLIKGSDRSQAEFLVPAAGRASLAPADFRAAAPEAAVARGAAEGGGSPGAGLAGFPLSFDAILLPDLSRGVFSSEEDKVVSFSALWGQARGVRGAQFATLMNADSGDTRGFLFAGLANAVKGRAGGVQFAPIANVALGGFGGLQLSGLANVSGGRGVGAQVGLVNVADRVVGAQVGLVNVARRIDGVAIGLVSIEEGGVFMPQLWTENASALRAGLAFGTRIVYTLVSAGVDVGASGAERPRFGLGIGGRLTLGPFFGDLDLSWNNVCGIPGLAYPAPRLGLRALAGFPAGKPGLLLGCALEGFVPGLSREDDGSATTSFRVEPRFLAGLKL
jgi:hypothetical protein